jgi:hypothetical protein
MLLAGVLGTLSQVWTRSIRANILRSAIERGSEATTAGLGESVIFVTADMREPDTGPPRERKPTSKVVAASTIGIVLEWYDFECYDSFVNASAAALVFGPLSSQCPMRP